MKQARFSEMGAGGLPAAVEAMAATHDVVAKKPF
jgi:hypothetical protein